MCDKEFTFYEGERKELTATVRSKTANETVVITKAEYEVKKYYSSDEVLKQGSCEIEGDKITVLLEFLEEGSYQLKVTAYVGREKIIEKVGIKVR